MPALAYRMGSRLAGSDIDSDEIGGVVDAALYPIPPWQPARGFTVDRALIYAMMRQESGFNTRALSPDGASGLARQSVVSGKSVSVRVDLGGRRIIQKHTNTPQTLNSHTTPTS